MADKPSHRIIAKMTDSRTDRWENVGVAWLQRKPNGAAFLSLRFSPFTDGAALVKADGVLIVPYQDTARDASGGNSPPPDSSPMPSDDDIPF